MGLQLPFPGTKILTGSNVYFGCCLRCILLMCRVVLWLGTLSSDLDPSSLVALNALKFECVVYQHQLTIISVWLQKGRGGAREQFRPKYHAPWQSLHVAEHIPFHIIVTT